LKESEIALWILIIISSLTSPNTAKPTEKPKVKCGLYGRCLYIYRNEKRIPEGRAASSAMWKKMFHYFQLNREEFMEHYHKRSSIESTNAAIKRKFGETLKSKNRVAQENELLAKIIAYNLTVVIHEIYENGIEPRF